MKNPSRVLVPLAAIAVPVGALVFLVWPATPPPTHAEVAALAEAGQVDAAEAKVQLLLDDSPNNPGANLLAAQIKMARCEKVTTSGIGTDPKPASAALESLRRIDSPDKALMAQARLWRGKAERYLGLLDAAEVSWLEALRLDPTIPEAGWLLLQEYYLQGRPQEARALALRLHRDEPDPHDRVRFLLEPLRQDVMPPDASSLVAWFEPIARRDPEGLHANLALGLALVRTGGAERGMKLLRKTAETHPRSPEAWHALLAGLEEMGDVHELSATLDRLPADLSSAPWIAQYRGRAAEVAGDWPKAVLAYRQALQQSPSDALVMFRLARALRQVGQADEADRLSERHRTRATLNQEARTLYETASKDASLGLTPHPDLYEALAALREKMGYPDQAEAWRRLAGTAPPPTEPSPGRPPHTQAG